MIITPKSTRQDTTEQASQPYRFAEEPKSSRWPLAFVAFLGGVTLYLKSMFPAGAEAMEGTPPKQRPQDDGGAPQRHDPALAAAQDGKEAAGHAVGSDHSTAGTGSAAGSEGGPVALQGRGAFESIVSPELLLADYGSFGPTGSGMFGGDGTFTIANDNASRSDIDAGVRRAIKGGQAGSDSPSDAGDGDEDGEDETDEHETDEDDDGSDDEGPDDTDGDGGNGAAGQERANRAPRVNGSVYLADVGACSVALIGLSDLLGKSVDPDGDALSVVNAVASSGSLTQAEGGWLFDAEGYGPVTITYQISDGTLTVAQTASFNVVRSSVAGTAGDDLLVGAECGDEIEAGEGNDSIDARGGSDTVLAGAGNDHVLTGDGADTAYAGLGDDIVFAGAGNDWISGGAGNDRLFGEAGDDTLLGDDGDDYVSGGEGQDLAFGGDGDDEMAGDAGQDRLAGGAGNDDLAGGDGDDVLMGEAGDDRLDGNAGNDILYGGDGRDVVEAGAGDDTVLGDLDAASDMLSGGEGFDTIDYSSASTSLVFDLASGTITGVEVGEDTISNFEVVVGGAGDDHFVAGGTGAVLQGGDGDDLFEFGTVAGALSGAGERVAYEILDFMAGDRIKVSQYEIFEEVMDSLEQRFEEVYGDAVVQEEMPILISHEHTGNVRRTLIEADLDNDDYYELAITITGTSEITISETV
jgi:Ca2+-binding RTX toxin-like protein